MVNRRPDYAIERYLQKHSSDAAPLYERYRVHRHHLEPIYTFWGEGFPGGNDHGWGHIERVLEKLDLLLGVNIRQLSHRELYLSMVSILYHDWAIISERKDHARVGAALVEARTEFESFTEPERDVVVAAIASHTSKADIAEQTRSLPLEILIGGDVVRPRVVAALVRLADELDEDSRRAPERVARIKTIGSSSEFYWHFCQCISGVQPKVQSHEIQFNVRFTLDDLTRVVYLDGDQRSFLSAFGEKLDKINHERQKVMSFLPSKLAYKRIVVTVNGIREIPDMEQPTTIILDDHTPTNAFVRAIPWLAHYLYRSVLSEALRLALQKRYDDAKNTLSLLEGLRDEMPSSLLMKVIYDLACFSARQAEHSQGTTRQAYAREALDYLAEWLQLGSEGVWEDNALLPENEVYRMARDTDLHYLVFERRDDLLSLLPTVYHWVLPHKKHKDAYGGGGGCVRAGTPILTPSGPITVEHLREGDVVLSYDMELVESSKQNSNLLSVRLLQVKTHRSHELVRINNWFEASRRQRVLCDDGQWRTTECLRPGNWLLTHEGRREPITSVRHEFGHFDYYDLSLAGYPHTFVVGSVVCHNSKLGVGN